MNNGNGAQAMIDALDKQTQQLQLEQKRGRGRPATGKALSNAERQRAYRERQKTQRNENKTDEIELLKARIAELELQLKKRNENKEIVQPEKWVVQMKTSTKGRWKTLTPKGEEWKSEARAKESLLNMPTSSGNSWYQVLQIQ